MTALSLEMRPLWDLRPLPGAAKVHTREQIAALAASIVAFGFDQPLVCDGQGNIIKGLARFAAARLLGMEAVPVLIMQKEVSPLLLRASRLADNRTARGHWEPTTLATELAMLEDAGREDLLWATGFTRAEIQGLLQREPPPTGAFQRWDVAAAPLPRALHCPRCGESFAA